jgi:hypothetical protein
MFDVRIHSFNSFNSLIKVTPWFIPAPMAAVLSITSGMWVCEFVGMWGLSLTHPHTKLPVVYSSSAGGALARFWLFHEKNEIIHLASHLVDSSPVVLIKG